MDIANSDLDATYDTNGLGNTNFTLTDLPDNFNITLKGNTLNYYEYASHIEADMTSHVSKIINILMF
ncbi:hypothetical protein POVCU2_0003250 [Plasmodium ovale curtisi]|uniref:Uncharacterized protein n=1 Tax=Plasmodium ovale curtisi TaxID=864141 RepID=A0A1A8VMX4_PLAOA|nr:hypothetical protein POVCU2_0003250 [Plasmodium ovale curtisi]